VKTTVEIEAALFQQAKRLAAKEGITFRDLLEEGLRTVVAARTSVRSKPFRLRDGSFQKGKGLQPGVDWRTLAAFAYQDEGGFGRR